MPNHLTKNCNFSCLFLYQIFFKLLSAAFWLSSFEHRKQCFWHSKSRSKNPFPSSKKTFSVIVFWSERLDYNQRARKETASLAATEDGLFRTSIMKLRGFDKHLDKNVRFFSKVNEVLTAVSHQWNVAIYQIWMSDNEKIFFRTPNFKATLACLFLEEFAIACFLMGGKLESKKFSNCPDYYPPGWEWMREGERERDTCLTRVWVNLLPFLTSKSIRWIVREKINIALFYGAPYLKLRLPISWHYHQQVVRSPLVLRFPSVDRSFMWFFDFGLQKSREANQGDFLCLNKFEGLQQRHPDTELMKRAGFSLFLRLPSSIAAVQTWLRVCSSHEETKTSSIKQHFVSFISSHKKLV